ncbi:hypothetical protein ACKWTF_016426 [Chironomus riparius]
MIAPALDATVSGNSNANNYVSRYFLNFLQKSSLKDLPIVKESVLAWDSFYWAYNETKDHFSVSENLRRVQEALRNSEVKQIGGHFLYDLNKFEEALKEIDRRLAKKVICFT